MNKKNLEFLHLWAQQLINEHRFICYQYELNLTKPVIELVDVSSYWGKWTPETRTISLAQSLLCDQPWDTVLNTLKHEMAHQLVSEELKGTPGHGADFRKVCEMLGIPAQFRKASSTIHDNQMKEGEQPPSNSNRIAEKIRKLLALADSSNEYEALLAMQKARQLQDRYNLDGKINEGNGNLPYSNLLINLKRKRIESYHRAICSLLLDYFHVEITITPLYDAHDLTTYKCIDIMGKLENVKIAGYVYHFLMDRLPSLWHNHLKTNQGSKNGKNSYWLGVLNGFRQGMANDRQRDEKLKATGSTVAETNLLPTVTHDQAMKLFVASRYPKLRTGRKSTARIDQARFEAGLKDGQLLKYRKGMNYDEKEQRLLGS